MRSGDFDALAVAAQRALDGEDFESALGLPQGWRSTLRFPKRDTLLRQAAALGPGPAASQLAQHLRRYRSTTWLRTRTLGQDPHAADSIESLLWRALRLVDRDIGRRQLARVLDEREPEPPGIDAAEAAQ